MSSENPFAGPLLSAELQYFRVPRDDWELMLARMRQLGANTIAACVPWSWHALRPDTFDFDGGTHPQRDLVGFVDLCGRLGLRVLLKPGPHVEAVLLGGVPAWLLYAYPEIQARGSDGQSWRHPADNAPRPSPLHPRYLEEARRWIGAFSTAMLAFQHPAGPVVAVQLDVGLDHRPFDFAAPEPDEGQGRPSTTDHPEGEGERGRGGESEDGGWRMEDGG
jgi:beta-galactosidase GanA